MFDFEEQLKPVIEAKAVKFTSVTADDIKLLDTEFETLQVEEQLFLNFEASIQNRLQSIDTESLTAADVESFRAYVVGAATMLKLKDETIGINRQTTDVPVADFNADLEGLKDFAKKAWEYIKKMVAKFSNFLRTISLKVQTNVKSKIKTLEDFEGKLQKQPRFKDIWVKSSGYGKDIYGQAVLNNIYDGKAMVFKKFVLESDIGLLKTVEDLLKYVEESATVEAIEGMKEIHKSYSKHTLPHVPKDLKRFLDNKSVKKLGTGTFYPLRSKGDNIIGVNIMPNGKLVKSKVKLKKIAKGVTVHTLSTIQCFSLIEDCFKFAKELDKTIKAGLTYQKQLDKLIDDDMKSGAELNEQLKSVISIIPYMNHNVILADYGKLEIMMSMLYFSSVVHEK